MIGHIAYADNGVLLARITSGLAHIMNKFGALARQAINKNKTKVLCLKEMGRIQKIVPIDPKIIHDNQVILAISFESEVKYMGLNFGPSGIVKHNMIQQLDDLLITLKSPYTKPQQKLWLLKNPLFGRFSYVLPFYDLSLSLLNQLDIRIRKFIRKIFHLPHDTPKAYYHTKVSDGGLGILDFTLHTPLVRKNRLNTFVLISRSCTSYYAHTINKLENYLKYDGYSFSNTKSISDCYKNKLYISNDGRDLVPSPRVKGQYQGIDMASDFIKGHDYINFNKLQINGLPTRVRVTRGSPLDKMCQACNSKTETLYHVGQGCPMAHNIRVKRHDNFVKYVAEINKKRGNRVIFEPRIATSRGLRKPDLVIADGTLAYVIDIQIVGSDQNNLENFNNNKINYYKNNSEIKDYILNRCSIGKDWI